MASLRRNEEQEFSELFSFFNNWTPQRDVIAFRYAPIVTATSTAITTGLFNQYFRKAVKLKGQMFGLSFVPNVVIPSILATGLHVFLIMKPLLIEERKCPVCLEVKSGVVSVLSSVVYPCLLIPTNVFFGASRYLTYPVPSPHKEPLECIKLVHRLIWKPFYPRICLFAAIQFCIGMSLAHFETTNYTTVLEKIAFMESVNKERRIARFSEFK